MDDDTIGRDGYDKDDNGNDNGDEGTFLLYSVTMMTLLIASKMLRVR